VTALPAEWDEAIVTLAEVQTHMRFHDYEKAAKVKEEWLDYVAGIIGAYDVSHEDRKDYMQPDPSYRTGGYGG
jgi:predicted transcriptional regulator